MVAITHMITAGALQQDNALAVAEHAGEIGNVGGSTLAQMPATGIT